MATDLRRQERDGRVEKPSSREHMAACHCSSTGGAEPLGGGHYGSPPQNAPEGPEMLMSARRCRPALRTR
ncbi:hypothetical protein EYF80_064312 [Liparis tanakae]|uniref:Uncharacterized protein n=1 Tax=Liparis tanakae TaxID=230148 RepID=A0A4Z2E9M0_9TELE|nr:hypothetical protein EYF80_064312 [Liparis tanakae]